MNKVKYQVFVSSTYEDLKEERDQVIKAILEMGHIPVGMEMFSAADEEQWKIITRQIDDSDYYVVILANRYGSMVEGVGYTEKEYDYAVAKGVPTLGFVLNTQAPWPSNRSELDKKAKAKLDAFKKKVKQKPVGFWSTKADLHGMCAIALGKALNTQPRPGWVRSRGEDEAQITAELSRLSSENAKLREEIAELRKSADTSGFAQEEDTCRLSFTVYFHSGVTWPADIVSTWNEIFYKVAKCIFIVPEEGTVRANLTQSYEKEILTPIYQKSKPANDFELFVSLSSNKMKDEDFELIRTQLLALELIQIGHNTGRNYWSLTPKGQRQYVAVSAQSRIAS